MCNACYGKFSRAFLIKNYASVNVIIHASPITTVFIFLFTGATFSAVLVAALAAIMM